MCLSFATKDIRKPTFRQSVGFPMGQFHWGIAFGDFEIRVNGLEEGTVNTHSSDGDDAFDPVIQSDSEGGASHVDVGMY